jgi:hypothetical protein
MASNSGNATLEEQLIRLSHELKGVHKLTISISAAQDKLREEGSDGRSNWCYRPRS